MQSSASIKIASALPFRLGVCISLIIQIGSSSIKLFCLVDFWLCYNKNLPDGLSIDGYFKWLPILKSSIIHLPLLSLLFMPLFLLKKHPHLLRSLCSAESSSFRKLFLFWSALAAKSFPPSASSFLATVSQKGGNFSGLSSLLGFDFHPDRIFVAFHFRVEQMRFCRRCCNLRPAIWFLKAFQLSSPIVWKIFVLAKRTGFTCWYF